MGANDNPQPKSVAVEPPVTNLIEAEGLVIASATDVGRRRTGNEDSHALWVSDDGAVRARQGMLFVVCDGMGGASAGEVASRLAVDTVVQTVRAAGGGDPAEALREAIEAANHVVHTQANANADQRGMGTTCTALVLRGGSVWAGHVGDSRAYLVRGGKVQKLTRDHSLVAELIEKGHLTEAEAKHDHRRNVVTRSVGALDTVQVDAERVVERLRPGDALVVCSDGLHGQVTDFEIGQIATESAPDEACRNLIELANERGGPDNITAIVARVAGAAPAAAEPPRGAEAGEPRRALPPHLGMLIGAAVVLGVLVLAVGWLLFGQLRKPAAVDGSSAGGAASSAGTHEPAATPEEAASPTSPPAGGTPAQAAPPRATPVVVETPENEAAPARPAPTPAAAATKAAPAKPAAATAAGPGRVLLTTRPFQPSTFFVDGEPYAFDVGFLSHSLPAGDHVIRVEGIEGGVFEKSVHVEAGGSYQLSADLPFGGELGAAQVTVTGVRKARVYVDGAQYPEDAPCTIRNLTPGSHAIVVRRSDGVPGQGPAQVTVTAGGTVRAEYKFGNGR